MPKKQEKIEELQSSKKDNIVKKQRLAAKANQKENRGTKVEKKPGLGPKAAQTLNIAKTPKSNIYRDYEEFSDWDEDEADVFFNSDYDNIMKSIKKNDLDSSTPY